MNNVIQTAVSGIVDGVNGNQVGVDPRLDPAGLRDYGGPTQTIALLPGSPAVLLVGKRSCPTTFL